MSSLSLLQGIWGSWVVLFGLGSAGIVRFRLIPNDVGAMNVCLHLGYPKQQDFFWAAAALLAAIAGVIAHRRLMAVVRRPPLKRMLPRLVQRIGWGWPVMGTLLALTPPIREHPLGLLAIAACVFVPWDWAAESLPLRSPGDPSPLFGLRNRAFRLVCLAALAVSFVWVFDPCWPYRRLDGYHEGNVLLPIQGWLSGDTPGVDTKLFYGPLNTRALLDWMKLFGISISAERGYFLACQIAGTAISFCSLALVSGSTVSFSIGAIALLTMSTASGVGCGWANALRPALGVAALALCGRAWMERSPWTIVIAGVTCAVSFFYSQDYGVSALTGCAVLVAVLVITPTRGGAIRMVGVWLLTLGVTALLLNQLLGGGLSARYSAASNLLDYGLQRLATHRVLPLAFFPWDFSLLRIVREPMANVDMLAFWIPVLTVAGSGGVITALRFGLPKWRFAMLAGATVAASVALLPAIAQPNVHIASSMPFCALLLVVLLDSLSDAPSLKGLGRLVGGLWLSLSAVAFLVMTPVAVTKWRCLGSTHLTPSLKLPRLGAVSLIQSGASQDAAVVDFIRARVPPGGRVLLAAPRHGHLLFLSDRAGVPPLMTTEACSTTRLGEEMIGAIERYKPRLALFTNLGVDLPLAEERPEILAYIRSHYRLVKRFGDLDVLERIASVR